MVKDLIVHKQASFLWVLPLLPPFGAINGLEAFAICDKPTVITSYDRKQIWFGLIIV